jgi:DNA-binding GntR family transcriptional regulator
MTAARRGGLADDIVSYVRERILAGEMKPGEKVDQDAIGEALDVSRSPIREALVILGQEGLLDITPRRGAFVASISRDDVIDHYELFGLISGRVAAMAATDLTDEQLDELRAIHSNFAVASADDHSKLNSEFHRLINAPAPRRTRWLLRHLERSIPAGFYGLTPGWTQTAEHGHEQILEAIIARDAAAAREAMEQHLHAAGVAAADALQERGFWKDETE